MNDKELPASSSPALNIVNYEDDSPQRIVNYFFDDESDDGDDDIETTLPSTSSLTANVDQIQLENDSSLPNLNSPTPAQEHLHDSDSSPPAKRRRGNKKYAAEPSQLPAPMIKFMNEVKEFFTKPMNLSRMSPAVASSTFEKTAERIRCK